MKDRKKVRMMEDEGSGKGWGGKKIIKVRKKEDESVGKECVFKKIKKVRITEYESFGKAWVFKIKRYEPRSMKAWARHGW